MEDDGLFTTCGHCGNKTQFQLIGEYADEDYPCSSEAYTTYALLKCLACTRPTLLEREKFFQVYDDIRASDIVVSLTHLFPANAPFWDYLPPPVEKAYNAAWKVRFADPGAYAVLVGKMLEVVCKQEGAEGKTLALKLQHLAKTGRIPDALVQMAHQLRKLRNFGAHADDDDEVRAEDVPVIREFAEAILEYLYVAPARVAAVQRRLFPNTSQSSTADGSADDIPF